MAVVETITIGAVNYSVYGLGSADPVGDADDYLAARIGSTWSTATTLQKQQAIVTAARLLDRAVFWSGSRTAPAQALEWPRDNAQNACTGEAVADGTIPDEIAEGQFELAYALFLDSSVQDAKGTGSNVKRVGAGSASVEFFAPTNDPLFETRLPQQVHDIVSCFFDGATGTSGFSSGTTSDDGKSCFDDDDQFNLDDGWP